MCQRNVIDKYQRLTLRIEVQIVRHITHKLIRLTGIQCRSHKRDIFFTLLSWLYVVVYLWLVDDHNSVTDVFNDVFDLGVVCVCPTRPQLANTFKVVPLPRPHVVLTKQCFGLFWIILNTGQFARMFKVYVTNAALVAHVFNMLGILLGLCEKIVFNVLSHSWLDTTDICVLQDIAYDSPVTHRPAEVPVDIQFTN